MANRLSASPAQMEVGLAILRVVTGSVFAAHGYQKFFGMGISGVTGFFSGLGVPFPHTAAIVVSSVELFGGIALILGLMTRLVAIPLAIDMFMAIILVHWKNGFFVPKGIEFALMLLTSSVALALAGAGAFSVDRILGRTSVDASIKRN